MDELNMSEWLVDMIAVSADMKPEEYDLWSYTGYSLDTLLRIKRAIMRNVGLV